MPEIKILDVSYLRI